MEKNEDVEGIFISIMTRSLLTIYEEYTDKGSRYIEGEIYLSRAAREDDGPW